jgi:hypothetical protein
MEATFEAGGEDAKQLREQLLARMGDISEFMKTFKQRFSIWFNRNHDRFGPLWAERFTSIIIEGNHHFALQMVAAYIDLNPVRAGMVRDPKDYRWSGYGEAEGIGGNMLVGLRLAVSGAELLSDKELLASYRVALFGKGAAPKRGDSKSARINSKDFANVLQADGNLSDTEHLQMRVSYFTRGAVIGGVDFVGEHLTQYRTRTKKRKNLEPTPFSKKHSDAWGNLYTMRRGA